MVLNQGLKNFRFNQYLVELNGNVVKKLQNLFSKSAPRRVEPIPSCRKCVGEGNAHIKESLVDN